MSSKQTEKVVTIVDNYGKTVNNCSFMYSTGNLTNPHFFWQKACKDEAEPLTFHMQQGAVGCKDYIMDTQYRNESTYSKRSWSDKEHRSNAVMIHTSPSQLESLQYYLNEILNPLCKKLGYETTEIYIPEKLRTIKAGTTKEIEYKKTSYTGVIVAGDDRWNQNGTLYSLYLSMIRVMACSVINPKHKTFLDLMEAGPKSNEKIYWGYAGKESRFRRLLEHYIGDITKLMVEIPDGYDKYTGYGKDKDIGHGATGVFYMGQYLGGSSKYKELYESFGMEYPHGIQKLQYFNDIFEVS